MGVADDHRVDRRVRERVGDLEDRALPRTPAALPTVLLPTFVPWWMTTIWTLTPRCRSRSDSALIRSRLGQERQPGRRAGRDELGRVLELGADDADLDAVDREDLRRRHPVAAPCRSRSPRCSSPGTGSAPAPAGAGAARPRSRTRGCRTTWRRGPMHSRRRSPACPRAAASSAARLRRCRRRRGSARARAAPPAPRRTSSRGTPPPPTGG